MFPISQYLEGELTFVNGMFTYHDAYGKLAYECDTYPVMCGWLLMQDFITLPELASTVK